MNPVHLARLGMVWVGLWLTTLLPLLSAETHAEHCLKRAAPQAYLYTGEQMDPDLGMYYLRARYYQPATGRFWNMDSYEGKRANPNSLHKYLYCHGDPINSIDPSGHFESAPSFAISSSITTGMGAIGEGAAIQAFRMGATRGLSGAMLKAGAALGLALSSSMVLGPGVAFMASDLEQNPTGSRYAGQNEKCFEFANDAELHFRREGKQPQRIIYRSIAGRTVRDTVGVVKGFGILGMLPGLDCISTSGMHQGILVDGIVYDNNVPWGVSQRIWEYGYYVLPNSAPTRETLLREAVRMQLGTITIQ